MRHCLSLLLPAVVVLLAAPAHAARDEASTVEQSSQVLNEIMAAEGSGIPQALLNDAQAVAVFPGVLKAGFVVAGRRGHGVVLVRREDGGWSNPLFLTLTAGSIGYQIGAQSTDVILVFKNRGNVDRIVEGKFTLGADAAVAAGPAGRQASASTDAQLQAEIYSYSRSRGLFAGVSLEGSVLSIDDRANEGYYRQAGISPVEIFTIGQVASPESAVVLQETLTAYAPPAGGAVPQPVEGGPALPEPRPIDEPAPAASETETRLAEVARRLEAKLDARWKRYLIDGAPHGYDEQPSAAALRMLSRFDRVAADSRYQRLADLEDFQDTHALLRQYVAELQEREGGLDLPPPPEE